jgi:hypothetical protein
MTLIEAVVKAAGPKVGPELWLVFVKNGPEVKLEVLRVAERLARDRLLAMENVRDVIGPHLSEIAELERAWAVLAHALEEIGE